MKALIKLIIFGKPIKGYPIMESKPTFKTVYPPNWSNNFNDIMNNICKQLS